MGFELREDEDTAERIRSYFKSKGGNMPENNLKQAMLPVGGTVFENNHGTAPGAALETASALLSCPALPASSSRCSMRACADF